MRANRIPIWIAGITLPYWIILAIFILRDLYLVYDSFSLLLKAIAPLALIANLIGVGIGMALLPKHKAKAGWVVFLNLLPLIGMLYFIWWLFFGVKI
jgi:hypothetical protein